MSQGQRQLLAIARAAVADPPVMILDEATSSIDTRTEAIVQRGMDALMKGRTVFVIAHRLSTVKNSDVIMVLEHGRIIERGTHEKLLEEKGKYYQLYTGSLRIRVSLLNRRHAGRQSEAGREMENACREERRLSAGQHSLPARRFCNGLLCGSGFRQSREE